MNRPDPTSNADNAVIWPELWDAFQPHRQKIFQLLQSLAGNQQRSLSVWGAGRTTDLDLIELTKCYRTIELIDLDPKITSLAMNQRGFDGHPQVHVRSGFDLSGLSEAWDNYLKTPDERMLKGVIEQCDQVKLDLPQYDVVASTCLLSQLARNAFQHFEAAKLGDEQTQDLLPQLVRAIRTKHVELMLDHTKPGGTALLVTDVTSATALPEMLKPNADLRSLMSNHVYTGNHFHGMNPGDILKTLREPRLASRINNAKTSAPWIWNSIETQYLCLAFRVDKK